MSQAVSSINVVWWGSIHANVDQSCEEFCRQFEPDFFILGWDQIDHCLSYCTVLTCIGPYEMRAHANIQIPIPQINFDTTYMMYVWHIPGIELSKV